MDITSFVGKLLEQDDVDLLREGVRVLAQAVMETEVSGQIGAGPYERSSSRTAYRNGYGTRTWDTRVGTIELKIPKVTAGAYFPSPARTAPPGREGPSRGRRRGLREGDLHARGRRPGACAGDRRDQPL
jgi:transposase-like protein